MHCPKCQALNRDGVQFCEDCGARLVYRCASCGAELAPDKRFCGHCGAAASATGGAAPVPVASARPEPLRPGDAERKQISVLFADVKSSMELIADRDPEEARLILDPIIERMVGGVSQYQGTVTNLMGDGIMALFGAPVAQEDHAVRACYAALSIRDRLDAWAAAAETTRGKPVQIRIGINSGEVVVRSLQSQGNIDYSALGSTTHLGARLEQLAEPGTILISATTAALIEGLFETRPIGPVAVRGLPAPVEVYQLLGSGAARSRLEAALATRGLTRFVGRETELARLHEVRDRAAQGRGQLMALVGEPGVGKSRLVHEFSRSLEDGAWLTLSGQCASYATETAYSSVVHLLQTYFAIERRDDGQVMAGKVSGKLAALGPDIKALELAFFWVLDIPVHDPEWLALDPTLRRDRVRTAILRLFSAESDRQPILLLFEDLQWADAETRSILDGLTDLLPAIPVLLVVTYRPEFEHDWSRRSFYSHIRVEPLSAGDGEQLLDVLLGADPSLRPVKPVLVSQTEGNPLFLEEAVRTLAESAVLVGEPGAYRTAKPISDIRVPASVHAVLAARIDRVSAADKRVLRAAAVLGHEVSIALLAAMLGTPEQALLPGLRRLHSAEFIYPAALFPEATYAFQHWLTHEVAYAGMVQSERKALHAAAVDALERVYADRIAENVEALARHALHGEVWEKAVAYCRRSAAQASGRSAHAQAAAFLDQAIEASRHLPETQANLQQGIDLRFAARSSLWPLWQHDAIFAHLREAERMATLLGDRRRLGWVASFMTQHYRISGDLDESLRQADRAMTIGREVGDLDLEVDTSFRAGLTCLNLGRYRQAIEYLGNNVKVLAAEQEFLPVGQPGHSAILSRVWLAICLAETGQFDAALAHAEQAVAIADRADHVYSRVSALFALGGAQLYRGDYGPARETLETGLGLCRQYDIPVLLRLVLAELGYALLLSGDADAAIPLLEDAAERLGPAPTMARHALYLTWLGEAYLAQGRIEEAREAADRALAIAEQRGERGHQAWALRLAGQLSLHGPAVDLATAAARFEACAELATTLGMRPLLGLAQLGLAETRRCNGQACAAETASSAAAGLFRELGMTSWLAHAGSVPVVN